MNIEKAIEILTADLTCDFHWGIDDWHGALHLGIEALERLIALRRLAPPFKTAEEALPSEWPWPDPRAVDKENKA